MDTPLKILIVEDETLVAMDLHGALAEGRFDVFATAGTIAAAINAIEPADADACLLGVNLRRSTARSSKIIVVF